MRYILITGGAGNIGGSLARKLVQDQDNFVVIVDNLLTGSTSKLPSADYSNWKFIKGDVNTYQDISAVMFRYSFDYVFHYAAVVGVQRTLENPMLVLADIEGLKNILGLSKNTGVRRVYYSSSSEVYGEPVEIPQNEKTTPLNSRLPYAIVKNLGEAYLKAYHQEYDLSYTVLRFFNTYGPLQSQDFVMTKFILAALKNSDIRINGDGRQTRTFCYIDDNLEATCRCLYGNHYPNDVLNIGNDEETSIVDLANLVVKVLNSSSRIIHQPPLAEGDMSRRKPDISKMKLILDRKLTTLEDGVLLMAGALRGTNGSHYGLAIPRGLGEAAL